ncbi:MAG: hypothetical protein IJ270_01420 [Paludibacteraceae bacterium]|nr:hypothetical protein [Paludibacteraceae bacterium]
MKKIIKILTFFSAIILLIVALIYHNQHNPSPSTTASNHSSYIYQKTYTPFTFNINNFLPNKPTTYETKRTKINKNYRQLFNDVNDIQLTAAYINGILPQNNLEKLDSLLSNRILIQVFNSKYLYSDAQMPYLVPKANDLLLEIAKRFQEETNSPKRIYVSSMLRTDNSIKKLRRTNRNSVKESCHLRGTTFDISYKLMNRKEKHILAQILYDLKSAGYCYVKYEIKQPCFHITVRK